MENLRRIREPLAWALIAVALVSCLLVVAQVELYREWADGDPSVRYWLAGLRPVPYGLVLALVAGAWGCAVAPAVPRARAIAGVAASITTATTIATLLQLAWTMEGLLETVEIAGLLASNGPDLMLGALGSIALWALALPQPASTPEEVTQDDATDEGGEDPALPEDRSTAVWSPTEAVGTAWRTADDAAAGKPGSTSFPSQPPDDAEEWRPPSG